MGAPVRPNMLNMPKSASVVRLRLPSLYKAVECAYIGIYVDTKLITEVSRSLTFHSEVAALDLIMHLL